jgi:hypothetical protein
LVFLLLCHDWLSVFDFVCILCLRLLFSGFFTPVPPVVEGAIVAVYCFIVLLFYCLSVYKYFGYYIMFWEGLWAVEKMTDRSYKGDGEGLWIRGRKRRTEGTKGPTAFSQANWTLQGPWLNGPSNIRQS